MATLSSVQRKALPKAPTMPRYPMPKLPVGLPVKVKAKALGRSVAMPSIPMPGIPLMLSKKAKTKGKKRPASVKVSSMRQMQKLDGEFANK